MTGKDLSGRKSLYKEKQPQKAEESGNFFEISIDGSKLLLYNNVIEKLFRIKALRICLLK